MLRTLGWLAVGLVTGVVAVIWLRPAADVSENSAGAGSAAAVSESAAADTALAREHAALVERVAELEEQMSRLTLALDAVSEQLAAAAERAESDDAESAAAVRQIEQRLVATLPAGFAEKAGLPPWLFENPEAAAAFEAAVAFAAANSGAPLTAESIAAAAASGQPVEAPMNLNGIEALPGQVLVFRVTGSNEGSVWGSDTYTDDSSIAAAAVHAGLLRPGETGTIMVTVQTGYQSYPASLRNGISSNSYGEWGRSFAIQRLN